MNASCAQYLNHQCPSLPMTGFEVWFVAVLGFLILAAGIWGLVHSYRSAKVS